VSSPLNSTEIQELYGSLRRVLHDCAAAQIRIIAGAAGWDLGQIPDGLDETGLSTRRPPIESAIDGQWVQWNEAIKAVLVRHLAQELITYLSPKGMAGDVNSAILKNGFRFENGDFVPTDARGQIPT
jgi:hypothetical protein